MSRSTDSTGVPRGIETRFGFGFSSVTSPSCTYGPKGPIQDEDRHPFVRVHPQRFCGPCFLVSRSFVAISSLEIGRRDVLRAGRR